MTPYEEMIENAHNYADCRHAAVNLLAKLSPRAMSRTDNLSRTVMVPLSALLELEAACDKSAKQVGYVAGLRARHGRGARGGTR